MTKVTMHRVYLGAVYWVEPNARTVKIETTLRHSHGNTPYLRRVTSRRVADAVLEQFDRIEAGEAS